MTSSYSAAMLRAAINSFILSNRSTILYLGPGSLYFVEECIAFEHSTVERYVTYMSKPTSLGGCHRARVLCSFVSCGYLRIQTLS